MAEGLIMFVRSADPPDVRRETCGRPASPDDEVYLVDEDGNVVPDGEPGELIVRGPYTLRGYFRSPEHNARAFTPDGFYRSGDLLRKHAVRQLRGRGPGQGPDQPGRREDQRGGGGEPHPEPPGRAQRGLRALPRSGARRADVRLPGAAAGPVAVPGGTA